MSAVVIERDAIIVVSRFDAKYPLDEPTCFVVGFLITAKSNSKSYYGDIQIPYTEIKSGSSDSDVVKLAFSKLRNQFQTWLENVHEKKAIIGSVFDPTV